MRSSYQEVRRSSNSTNYKNWWSPTDPNEYFYYGEWHGCQDMTMTGGNAVIADPARRLCLFDGTDYVYEGQFRYVDHFDRLVGNPSGGNRQFKALIFRLRRTS